MLWKGNPVHRCEKRDKRTEGGEFGIGSRTPESLPGSHEVRLPSVSVQRETDGVELAQGDTKWVMAGAIKMTQAVKRN